MVVRRGDAGPTLVQLSSDARLLVVGSRGRGAIAGSILGSTSAHCAHHTKVPVAIVPPGIDPRASIEEVVVGVDGSASSIEALRWALRSTPADAVIDIHFAWMSEPLARTLTTSELERVRAASVGFLDAVVDRVLAEEDAWIVVGARSEQGLTATLAKAPADALIHASRAVLVLVPPPMGSSEGVRHGC